MLGHVIDAAGFDRDQARTAVPRATTRIDFNSEFIRQIQQRTQLRFPRGNFSRSAESDLKSRRAGFDHHNGCDFFDGGRTECLEENTGIRDAPRGEFLSDAVHKRPGAAEIKFKIVRGQKLFHQSDADPLGMLKVAADLFGVSRLAEANMEMKIFVVRRQFQQMFTLNKFVAIARAEEKPDFALRPAFQNRVGHAQHRSDPDPAGNENDGRWFLQIEKKMSGWRFDIEDVAYFQFVAKKFGGETVRNSGLVRRREGFFNGDAIKIFAMTIGQRVAADDWFIAAGNIELERQILSGLESGQRLAVVRREIE